MKVTTTQFAQAYWEIASGASAEEAKRISKNFAALLRRRKMLRKKGEILAEVIALRDEAEKHLTARVRTAKKLTHEELAHITRTLKKAYSVDAVTIEETIDEALIGGADIQVGWEKVAGSIKHRLNTLKYSL